jgi:hypothetical protein
VRALEDAGVAGVCSDVCVLCCSAAMAAVVDAKLCAAASMHVRALLCSLLCVAYDFCLPVVHMCAVCTQQRQVL